METSCENVVNISVSQPSNESNALIFQRTVWKKKFKPHFASKTPEYTPATGMYVTSLILKKPHKTRTAHKQKHISQSFSVRSRTNGSKYSNMTCVCSILLYMCFKLQMTNEGLVPVSVSLKIVADGLVLPLFLQSNAVTTSITSVTQQTEFLGCFTTDCH